MVNAGLRAFEMDEIGEHKNHDEQNDDQNDEENKDSVGLLHAASSWLLSVLKLN